MKLGICGGNEKIILNDGKWVAQIPLDEDNEYKPFLYQFVGSIPKGLIRYEADELDESDEGYGAPYLYLVADEPFIVIADGAYISIAREIHKGELGRMPEINTPDYIKGYYDWHWAKLTDVSEYAGMEPEKLFSMFHRFQQKHRFETGMICCIYGPNHEYPKSTWKQLNSDRCGYCEGMNEEDYYRGRCRCKCDRFEHNYPVPFGEPFDVKDIWVPAGWANNVLRLVKFGYPKTIKP